ncbi:MAG TPA: histidine kinase [Chitinophagales bacterium]|nr:histidine kinase [Chitinophagales bacterium]
MILLFFSSVQCLFCTTNFVINKQVISKPITQNTFIDSSYLYFKTYLADKIENKVSILQEYNNIDYRLDKYILLAVQYINTSDTIVVQNLYSYSYSYKSVGELDKLDSNSFNIKPSEAIKCNQQFLSIRLMPRQTVFAYILYKPIAYKEYPSLKNILYNYATVYDFPHLDPKIQHRNFGFTIQYLFLLGMILIMFIFYVIAYYYLHEKIYLYYTFYLFATFVQVLYMFQYTICKSSIMFNIAGNNVIDEVTKGFMIYFYCLFYKQAFTITKKVRIVFYSVEALKYFSIVYIAFITLGSIFHFPFYVEPFAYHFFRIPILILSLIFLTYTYFIIQRNYFQNIIFFGTFVYIFFTALAILQNVIYSIIDLYVDINIFYLGVAFELIIFSIALIIRIKDSFLASEKLKDKLIVELQQNEEFIKNENSILEEKVKERVSEIKQQNLLIEQQQRQALIQAFEKEKIEIQMQALSSQMNPHFIFNCMNSIQHSIVTNDTEKASTMLHDFALLIRMVLENSSQPDITLEDEIKLLETYLKLEQVRTGFLFDYEIKADTIISKDFVKIPTMLLQPFLENAIWHGFKFINYKGKINVEFSMIENIIRCIITDNGIGRTNAQRNTTTDTNKKSMAIPIIQNRIHLINQTLNDIKASMQIVDLIDEEQNATGTKVIVELPIL